MFLWVNGNCLTAGIFGPLVTLNAKTADNNSKGNQKKKTPSGDLFVKINFFLFF